MAAGSVLLKNSPSLSLYINQKRDKSTVFIWYILPSVCIRYNKEALEKGRG
jgi:hypothetical protein